MRSFATLSQSFEQHVLDVVMDHVDGEEVFGNIRNGHEIFSQAPKRKKPIKKSIDDKMASFVGSMASRDPHDVYSTAAPRSKMLR